MYCDVFVFDYVLVSFVFWVLFLLFVSSVRWVLVWQLRCDETAMLELSISSIFKRLVRQFVGGDHIGGCYARSICYDDVKEWKVGEACDT